MKTRAILAFLLAQLAFSGMAQKLPDWIVNKPRPTNNTYLYVVESATGQNEMQARNRAIAEVFRSTAMRIGQPFDSEEINRALQRGTEYYVISSQYNIPINKVCEYTDNKTSPCRVYVLCQVAKAGNIIVDFDYSFNGCHDVKQYRNGSALVKSMFLPGLGQMSKRRYGEGVFALLSEVVLAGGTYVSYYYAQNQLEIMKNPNTGFDDFMKAKEMYNYMQLANKVCLGTAAAVYVFNLYRAYAATPKYKKSYALVPTIMSADNCMAYGVSLTYQF